MSWGKRKTKSKRALIINPFLLCKKAFKVARKSPRRMRQNARAFHPIRRGDSHDAPARFVSSARAFCLICLEIQSAMPGYDKKNAAASHFGNAAASFDLSSRFVPAITAPRHKNLQILFS